MKEYENALRKIDEEMGKVSEQIEIYAVKRNNEKFYLTKLTLEEKGEPPNWRLSGFI